MLTSINPASGETLAHYPLLTEAEIEARISAAAAAQPGWSASGFAKRGHIMLQVAAALRADRDALSKIMALEMGKPVKEGLAEVDKAIWCIEHYAEHAERYLAAETLPSDARHSYVCYAPLGTVLNILPWNLPVWLAFRSMAPALMAGNTCVMKHDPHVQGVSHAILAAFRTAGVPANIVVDLPVDHDGVAIAIAHRSIAALSFTGSSAAGAKVAAAAGSSIKPAVLELGGSDPFVVLADADLTRAAQTAVLSRTINAGQSCIAAKRIIVEAPVYAEFCELLRTQLAALRQGDPLDPSTQLGPLARADLRDNLARQVRASIAAGARCLLGGAPVPAPGFYFPATLLVDVTPTMPCFDEETFGPVACVTRAADADEALALANHTEYGLGAAIWTGSEQTAMQFASKLEAGQVAVNGLVKTDPRLPSGGIKRSGYGRELGAHGIREFVNAKQIWLGPLSARP